MRSASNPPRRSNALRLALILFCLALTRVGGSGVESPRGTVERVRRSGADLEVRLGEGADLTPRPLGCVLGVDGVAIALLTSEDGRGGFRLLAQREETKLTRGLEVELPIAAPGVEASGPFTEILCWSDLCGAVLELDGKAVGETPIRLVVEPGPHVVRARFAQGDAIAAEVIVPSSGTCLVSLTGLRHPTRPVTLSTHAEAVGLRPCPCEATWVEFPKEAMAYVGGTDVGGPVPTRRSAPACPLGRRHAVAEVACVVDQSGRPTHAWVAGTSDPGYAADSLAAMKQWSFQPATRDGAPVPSLFATTFSCGR